MASLRGSPIQAHSPPIQVLDSSPLELLGFKGHHSLMLDEGCLYPMGCLPALVDPGSTSSSSFAFGSLITSPSNETHWGGYSSNSELSFGQAHKNGGNDHEEECDSWITAMDLDSQVSNMSLKAAGGKSRVTQDQNCFEMATGYGLMHGEVKERKIEGPFGLLYRTANAVDVQQERATQKRHVVDGEIEAAKKHCVNARKTKVKPTASKDPQSIAAKTRRERISERLKVLQDLVPNGNKVDLVTMLEKAISYVKFLQLQVKVLATDELWPAQGGKAPEIGQVKEAIDAILSSHKERNSKQFSPERKEAQ